MNTQKPITLNEIIRAYNNSDVPQWVLKLIADRISNSKIPTSHWEDFFQDCIIWYLKSEKQKYKYIGVQDSTRVMGGVNVIFRALRRRIRSRPKLQKKFAMTRSEVITIDFIRIADEAPLQSLRRAVRHAVAELDEEKQIICKLIMNMLEPREVCKRLGKSHWYFKRQIKEIRQEFCRRGILDIVKWRRDYLINQSREA